MPISSVNLDEETQAISKRVGNFSEFVRECLRRWNTHDTATHVHPTETPKCYPDSKRGCCLICWPQGRPNKNDWFYFRDTGRNGGDYAVKWIEEKARESNRSPEFQIPTGNVKKMTLSPHPKGSFWTRIKAKLGLE